MSSMMGGQAGTQEDMFAKLDSMRQVISEVNNQFKDPVRHMDTVTRVCLVDLSWTYRRRQRSFACVFRSSSPSTRRSVSFRNSRHTKSILTTSSSTSSSSPNPVRIRNTLSLSYCLIVYFASLELRTLPGPIQDATEISQRGA